MINYCFEVDNVSKVYKTKKLQTEVLKKVTFKIKKGEFISIMGPSGSGKSTLLYLLGGIEKPSSGIIKMNNKIISSLNDRNLSLIRRKELGFIFQFYNLVPNLNVVDNVMLPIALDRKKTNKYQEKIDEILNLVGLYERKKHTPKELSGGQQQRVAIARALIFEPEIILADEPTGNLDSKSSEDIMNLLKRINITKKRTIIQVTHSDEDSCYSDRTIFIRDGRIRK